VDTLVREGCGYTGKHAPDFMQAKDPWFRGIDLLTGPDGNVFVADWSDSGECHDNDGIHRTSGRIYKIVYGEPKKAEPINVATMKKEEWVKLLESNNNWWVRTAQQSMWQMVANGYEPFLSADLPGLSDLANKAPANTPARLAALSTKTALGVIDGSIISAHLADENESLRMNALKNQLIDRPWANDQTRSSRPIRPRPPPPRLLIAASPPRSPLAHRHRPHPARRRRQ
jgi:hypothetical protein